MFEFPANHLIRLRPRADTLYVSQNRTVLATERDGFINAAPDTGFFVQGTRLLSRYRYRMNGALPTPNGLSNVEQHTWLGYYIAPGPIPAETSGTEGPGGATAQHTIELRRSRFVSDGRPRRRGRHDFSQRSTQLILDLEIDADFADTAETKGRSLNRLTDDQVRRQRQ